MNNAHPTKSIDETRMILKIPRGREIGMGMRNLGNPVWGNEFSFIIRSEEFKQGYKALKKLFSDASKYNKLNKLLKEYAATKKKKPLGLNVQKELRLEKEIMELVE